MKLDLDRLDYFASRGALVQRARGDAHETACALSAVAGVTSDTECIALGWPRWLAEIYRILFDNAPKNEALAWAREVGAAIKAADRPGADWDRIKRDLRLRAILPIALENVGDGDEPWRTDCRNALQWSIANDGADNPRAVGAARAAWDAWAAGAARAAEAAGAAGAAEAAEAAEAARAAGAAGAAEAAEAAWAAEAAYRRIKDELVEILKERSAA
jgi:hypothetical protein